MVNTDEICKSIYVSIKKNKHVLCIVSKLFQISNNTYIVLAAIWTLLTLYLSVISARTIASLHLWNIFGLDKLGHATFYMFFSLFWCMSVSREKNRSWMVLLVSITFGILMEIGQYLMLNGRTFELLDIVANTFGAILGVYIFKWLLLVKKS